MASDKTWPLPGPGLTPEQVADIRERHRSAGGPNFCKACGFDAGTWRCDAARLLDALEETNAENERRAATILTQQEQAASLASRDLFWHVERERQKAERERDELREALDAVLHYAECHGRTVTPCTITDDPDAWCTPCARKEAARAALARHEENPPSR